MAENRLKYYKLSSQFKNKLGDIAEMSDKSSNHDCNSHLTYDATRQEIVCMKCGIVIDDHDLKDQFYAEISSLHKLSTAVDHSAGDGLLDSLTPSQGYFSARNPGVAMTLGRHLVNPYKTGLIADERGAFVREDPLSHEKHVEFSRYYVNLENLWKRRAENICSDHGLDTVEKTLVARTLKRLYSQLLLPTSKNSGSLAEYVIKAAIIDAGILQGKERENLEKEMYADLDKVRILLISRGDATLKKELRNEELRQNQQQQR